MELLEKAIGLKARERAIRQDTRYSDEYKKRLLAENTQAIENLKAKAFTTFKREWENIAGQLDQMEVKQKKAENAEAARWDYRRLSYEAKSAQSLISTATDTNQVLEAYSKALDSGDREKARAWAEVAPGAIKEKLNTTPNQRQDAQRLISSMKRDQAAIRMTDELAAVQTEAGRLVQKALDLDQQAKDLDRHFSPGIIGGYDRQPRLADVIGEAGLKLSREFDDQTQLFTHRLERKD